MIEAIALASSWLSVRNDEMLPGWLSWDELCSAPIMPPELSALWIADCASASQLDDVLDAMAGVAAMVESADASGLVAGGLLALVDGVLAAAD